MNTYIKKFNDVNDGDGYVISSIPFIATVRTTKQNIVCNQPGKKLVKDGDKLKVEDGIIHFTVNVVLASWGEVEYNEDFACSGLTNMSFEEWYNSEYVITDEWGDPLFDLYDEWADVIEGIDVKLEEGGIYHYYYNECKCLLPGTNVTMSNGLLKHIEDVELGDSVLSLDLETGDILPRKVIFTNKETPGIAKEWDEWEFSDGSVIKTAAEHEFYNVEKGKFEYLSNWNIGEHTYKEDGTTPSLVSHKEYNEEVKYYKLTLEDSTNYFANGLLTGDRNCNKLNINIL